MALDKDKSQIGFIGLGVMGHSMAEHILAAGYGWIGTLNSNRGSATHK